MSTLNQNQLFEIAECRRKSALIDWLRENGIKYTYSRKGRVVSTEEQINIALAGKDREEVIEFGATTLETVFTKIEEASLKAGQDLVKAWDEDEETITTAEKQEVNDH